MDNWSSFKWEQTGLLLPSHVLKLPTSEFIIRSHCIQVFVVGKNKNHRILCGRLHKMLKVDLKISDLNSLKDWSLFHIHNVN